MPVRFTFKQLEYFVAVGETGSIAQASEKISISPPSISAAIAQLEAEFNVQLFIRHHAQGLSLTPGGREILREARRLLAQADELRGVAEDIAELVRGHLSVGCLVTLSPFVLPELRRGFMERYPETEVSQEEAHQIDLFQKLRRAEIDIAITYDLELPQDIEFEPLAPLPPHALVAPDHPFAARKSVGLEELAEEPMILLDLPLSREYFLSLFQNADLRPRIAERTQHLPMVRTLAANGFGYGLLNVPSKNEHAPDGKPLKYIPIKGDPKPMNIGLITMKTDRKSRVLSAFEEFCRDRITAEAAPGMTNLNR